MVDIQSVGFTHSSCVPHSISWLMANFKVRPPSLHPTTPPNAFRTLESEPLTHFGWWPWRASPEWMSYLSRRCLCAWQRKTKLSFVQRFYCSPTDLLQPYWWLFRVSGVKKRGNSGGGNQDVADLSQQSFFHPQCVSGGSWGHFSLGYCLTGALRCIVLVSCKPISNVTKDG